MGGLGLGEGMQGRGKGTGAWADPGGELVLEGASLPHLLPCPRLVHSTLTTPGHSGLRAFASAGLLTQIASWFTPLSLGGSCSHVTSGRPSLDCLV